MLNVDRKCRAQRIIVCDSSDSVLLAILLGEHRATNTVLEKLYSFRTGDITVLALVTIIDAIILTIHR